MKINYTVELLLPAVTASLGVIGKDIDITVKKDKDGYPIFNGKHIKGILRERVVQFKRALGVSEDKVKEFENRFFGKEGNYIKDNNFEKIRFSNLSLKDKDKLDKKTLEEKIIGDRHGIRINRKTKTTIPKSLFNYEFLLKNNVFEGSLEFNDSIEKEDLKFILACLFHLDKIGGMKSRGIGKVRIKINNSYLEGEKDVKVTKKIEDIINELMKTKKEESPKIEENNFEKYSYTIELKEPLVMKLRELGNFVEVRNSIQGSTVRGAIIEHFYKKDKKLMELLQKIEVSDANLKGNKVPLASTFETKYVIKSEKNQKKKVDKVISSDIEYKKVKLERASLGELKTSGNEISVKINTKTKSAENGMLFNTEYIHNSENKSNLILNGVLKIPKNLLKEKEEIVIYLGKYKSKGFGEAILKISKYSESQLTKEKLKEKINNLSSKVKLDIERKIGTEDEKLIRDEICKKDEKVICFDLQSDLIIPFLDIYDAGKQFLILAGLDRNDIKFNPKRSFINTGKLEGYNIINNIRKVDELIFCKGSVFTYNVSSETCDEILEKLLEVEKNGIGLRKNEGFGNINICTERGDN